MAKRVQTRQTDRPSETRPNFRTAMGQSAVPQVVTTLSHQQIAERAYHIWVRKGRPHGLDEQNWREAEAELVKQRTY